MMGRIKERDEEPVRVQEPIRIQPAAIPQQERTDQPDRKPLTNRMDELEQKLSLLSDKEKAKMDKMFRVKLPWKVKMQVRKIYKKKKILIFLLKNQRTIEPIVGNLINGLIEIEGRYYTGSPDFTFLYKGKIPCAVIPEWSLNPVGTKDYYEAVEKKMTIDPQVTVIRAMRLIESEPKVKMKMGGWIFILIGAAIVGYIIYASMSKEGK